MRPSYSFAYEIGLMGEDIGGGLQKHFPILQPMSHAEVKISCKSETKSFFSIILNVFE